MAIEKPSNVTLTFSYTLATESDTTYLNVSASGLVAAKKNTPSAGVKVNVSYNGGTTTITKQCNVIVKTQLKDLGICGIKGSNDTVDIAGTIQDFDSISYFNGVDYVRTLKPKYYGDIKTNQGAESYTVSDEYQGVTWKSSNTSVANISNTGELTVKTGSMGSTKISCYSKTNNNLAAYFTINTYCSVKDFELNAENVVLYTNAEPTSYQLIPNAKWVDDSGSNPAPEEQ
jgi:hypothetical protein